MLTIFFQLSTNLLQECGLLKVFFARSVLIPRTHGYRASHRVPFFPVEECLFVLRKVSLEIQELSCSEIAKLPSHKELSGIAFDECSDLRVASRIVFNYLDVRRSMAAACSRKACVLLLTKGGLSHDAYCFFRPSVRLRGHHRRQNAGFSL